jgi:hypothetical protein
VTQYAGLLWTQPGGAKIPIQGVYLRPPAGPDAPGGLTAVPTPNAQQVTVSWNASTTPIAADSYVLMRSTTPGGPYTQIAVQAAPDVDFVDNNVVFDTTYYYVVQATAYAGHLLVGPASPEMSATPQQALSVSPLSGLATSENLTNDTITITVNVVPTSDVSVTLTSDAPLEALLQGNGPGQLQQGPGSPITIIIPAGTLAGTTIQISVRGQNDDIDDGDKPFSISFSVSGGGTAYTGIALGPCTGTNQDNDTANIIVSAISNPTSENLTTATFDVTFTTAPSVDTTVTLVSSDTGEGTVPASITFTAAAGAATQTVTVTGVDDAILDFTQPYTITVTVTAGDPNYMALTSTPIVRNASNLDNERIPALKHVWGCGLTGVEIFLPLGLLSLWRRRRKNS